MAELRGKFADAEDVVCTMLERIAPTATRATDPLPERLILVQRVGGPNNEHTDFPVIEVSVLASMTATQTAPREVAWDLAEQCRQVMLAATRTLWDGALIDSVENVTPVTQQVDENPDVRRVVATYELEMRRPRPSGDSDTP